MLKRIWRKRAFFDGLSGLSLHRTFPREKKALKIHANSELFNDTPCLYITETGREREKKPQTRERL